jgi:hypothetical protein
MKVSGGNLKNEPAAVQTTRSRDRGRQRFLSGFPLRNPFSWGKPPISRVSERFRQGRRRRSKDRSPSPPAKAADDGSGIV